ncbi:MAG: hypothetical protein M3Y57_06230 [Acidobacteriota bacterium]|nr:hypothetical protein [Acidobacteriota bacterium]
MQALDLGLVGLGGEFSFGKSDLSVDDRGDGEAYQTVVVHYECDQTPGSGARGIVFGGPDVPDGIVVFLRFARKEFIGIASKQKCVSCGLRVRAEPVFNCGMPGGATYSAGGMDPTAHPQMLLASLAQRRGPGERAAKIGRSSTPAPDCSHRLRRLVHGQHLDRERWPDSGHTHVRWCRRLAERNLSQPT